MTHQENIRDNKPTATTRSSSTSSSTTSSSTTTTTTSSTTTGSSIPTHPGVLTVDQWDEIKTLFEGCGLGVLSMPVVYMIRDFVGQGMTYEVIREAIMETGFAPRPSAYYLRAVLNRAAGDDIQTLDEWNAAKSEYKYNVRKKWWRPSWERDR